MVKIAVFDEFLKRFRTLVLDVTNGSAPNAGGRIEIVQFISLLILDRNFILYFNDGVCVFGQMKFNKKNMSNYRLAQNLQHERLLCNFLKFWFRSPSTESDKRRGGERI